MVNRTVEHLELVNNRSPALGNALLIAGLAVLFFAILAASVTKPLGRDENMYCAGGVLLAQGKMIYRDFSYVAQLPYHALVCAAVFKLANTTYYLLAARLVSVACDIGVVLCILSIYRRVFSEFTAAGKLLGLAAATLYVFNPIVDYANGHAWNNDVVICCVMLSLWLLISARSGLCLSYWRAAGIAVLLTLATCMRMTTAIVQLLFLIFLLVGPAKSAGHRLKNTLCFLIGTAVVLLWPIRLIIEAPRAARFNLLNIQLLNSKWLHQIGLVHNKSDLLFACLTMPGYLAVVLLAICLFATAMCLHRRLQFRNIETALITVLVASAFFAVAFTLPTMWPQHLAFPIPFLITALVFPLLWLRKPADNRSNQPFKIAAAAVTLTVLIAIASYPAVLFRIPKVFAYRTWEPVKLHRIAQDLAARMQSPKLVLTLAPLYALEGGCDIYTELSAGPFAFRVGDLMTPQQRTITHTTSPQTLQSLIGHSPPTAVLLGVEPDVEQALFRAAIEPHPELWRRRDYDAGPTAYFRRSRGSP